MGTSHLALLAIVEIWLGLGLLLADVFPQQFHTLLEHGDDLEWIRLYQATALDKGECQDLLFDETRIQDHPNFLPVLFCRGRMKNLVGTFTSRGEEYFNMVKSLVRARVMYG